MDEGPQSGPASVRSEGTPGVKKAAYGWPIGLSFVALAALGAAPLVRERVARPAPPTGEVRPWVDPAAATLVDVPTWVDPRWLERVRSELARTPPFDVGDTAFLEPLTEALRGLSFVESVTRCELSAAGGLELELALREPVACIPSRGDYLLVDEDGVVLEGRWALPPRLAGVPLPVLAADELFERARPGDWLVEPEHEDALDVALSLAEHLSVEERTRLGRIEIDAKQARRASVEEPGVRLALEGERLALFGRGPASDEPGELAADTKWRTLVRALELFSLDPSAHDWSLVDLRWDRPELVLKNAPVTVARTDEAPRASVRPRERERRERDPSKPHVR